MSYGKPSSLAAIASMMAATASFSDHGSPGMSGIKRRRGSRFYGMTSPWLSVQPKRARVVTASDRMALETQSANATANVTLPGYRKRTTNIKKLRRKARRLMAF